MNNDLANRILKVKKEVARDRGPISVCTVIMLAGVFQIILGVCLFKY